MKRTLLLTILLGTSLAAQSSIDGITTSVSRTIALPPENAVFAVSVSTSAGATVADAVAALGDTGITAANLVSASTTSSVQFTDGTNVTHTGIAYVFQITVPYANLKDMVGKLDKANKLGIPTVAYGFSLTASDAAVQDARRKAIPDLYAEARRRAENLADATTLSLGTIQSVAESLYPQTIIPVISSTFSGVLSASSSSSNGLQVTFTLTVRFNVSNRSY